MELSHQSMARQRREPVVVVVVKIQAAQLPAEPAAAELADLVVHHKQIRRQVRQIPAAAAADHATRFQLLTLERLAVLELLSSLIQTHTRRQH